MNLSRTLYRHLMIVRIEHDVHDMRTAHAVACQDRDIIVAAAECAMPGGIDLKHQVIAAGGKMDVAVDIGVCGDADCAEQRGMI